MKQMVDTLRTQQERLKTLEAEATKGGQKRGGKEAPTGDDDGEKPLEEQILENPEEVIKKVVEKHYGGVIQTLSSDVSEAVERTVASEVDDFDAYREDVNTILRENGAARTKQNLKMAYELAVGRRALDSRRQEKNKQMETEQTRSSEEKTTPQLQEPVGLEKEVWQASGMTLEDWNRFKDPQSARVKVPTGKAPAKKEA